MTRYDCDLPKLLAAASVGVARKLEYAEERALWEESPIGYVIDVSGVLLTDGRALLCAADCDFSGSDVTDPDKGVAFRIIPADVVREKLAHE